MSQQTRYFEQLLDVSQNADFGPGNGMLVPAYNADSARLEALNLADFVQQTDLSDYYTQSQTGALVTAEASARAAADTALQSAINGKEAAIAAGTTAQYWRGDKTWQTLNKGAVGLGNVDNTSDASKPISTLTQAALDLKAPLLSPALTGLPTAPTATLGDNSTKLATTAFVNNAIQSLINLAPSTLDTLGELAAQLQSDESALSALTTTVGTKLAKASNLSDLADAATARFNLGLGNVENAAASTLYSVLGHTHTFASLTSKPTTLAGYSISDAAPLSHVSDTSNPHSVTKAQVGLGSVENTALSTWAGSTNLTTLGTVTTGVWHGSAIGDTYIASAATWNAKIDQTAGDARYLQLSGGTLTGILTAPTLVLGGNALYAPMTLRANGLSGTGANFWNFEDSAATLQGFTWSANDGSANIVLQSLVGWQFRVGAYPGTTAVQIGTDGNLWVKKQGIFSHTGNASNTTARAAIYTKPSATELSYYSPILCDSYSGTTIFEVTGSGVVNATGTINTSDSFHVYRSNGFANVDYFVGYFWGNDRFRIQGLGTEASTTLFQGGAFTFNAPSTFTSSITAASATLTGAFVVNATSPYPSNLLQWGRDDLGVQGYINNAGTLVLNVPSATGGNNITANSQPVVFDAPGIAGGFTWGNGKLELKTPLVVTHIGAATNDSTQAALFIKPSSTELSYYQFARFENSSGALKLAISKNGYIFDDNYYKVLVATDGDDGSIGFGGSAGYPAVFVSGSVVSTFRGDDIQRWFAGAGVLKGAIDYSGNFTIAGALSAASATISGNAVGISTSEVITLTNANVTLTAFQVSKRLIVLRGTLTGNVNIVCPDVVFSTLILNECVMGAYTITVKRASTAGQSIVAGQLSEFYYDGV